jgi:hypothetical protein
LSHDLLRLSPLFRDLCDLHTASALSSCTLREATASPHPPHAHSSSSQAETPSWLQPAVLRTPPPTRTHDTLTHPQQTNRCCCVELLVGLPSASLRPPLSSQQVREVGASASNEGTHHKLSLRADAPPHHSANESERGGCSAS